MSKKKNPTIYDVAEISGVSISTISRVLNSPDKVNSETHKRVMQAIDRLGFVPKAEARARAMQHTGRIGVITPFFTAPSFVQRLRGVASVLSKSNYELVIYPVDSMELLQGYISSIPVMKNIDGLIIMSLAVSDQDVQRLIDNGIGTALIEYQHPQLNSITINDYDGGCLAAEHLIKKGHRNIGFLGDIEPPERLAIHPVKSRLVGFQKTLSDAGISMSKSNIRSAPYTKEESRQAAYELLSVRKPPEESRRAAHELLSLPKPPSAIFAASDVQALVLMKVARQLNIKVPDDLAVIGFDDIDVAEHVDLTTIRQHLDESGRLAAEILLARISESHRPLQHINLPLNLIERQTT